MTAPYQPPPVDPGMTPAQIAALLVLVQAQAAVRQRITATAMAAATAAFRGFTDWWNPDAVDKAIAQALKVIQPAQRQAAQVTDAYLTRVSRLMTGKQTRPAGVIDVAKLRRSITDSLARELADGRREPAWVVLGDTHDGPSPDINQPVKLAVRDDTKHVAYVKPTDPYGRIADQFRYQVITQGATEDEARGKALTRIAVAAENDVTMAVREQYHKTMGAQKADGYRRILHPELTRTGPCGLCVVAADRVYRVRDLMPLHGRCACEVLPIYGKKDPGVSLNHDDLDKLYAAAGSPASGPTTSGRALKKVRVALAENGETGPVLVDADHDHRGPVEVARGKVGDKETRLRLQLAQWERSFETLQHRALRGENVTKSLKWQRVRIAELRRELGIADDHAPAPARTPAKPRGPVFATIR